MGPLPQAGWSPAGQYQGAAYQPRQAIYTGELSPVLQNYNQVLGASTGQVYGPPAPTYGPAVPASSGQAAAPSGAGNMNLTPPSNTYTGPNPNDVVNQLKSQYSQAASDISNQAPLLDQSYNTAKGDIQSQLNLTTQQAQGQRDQLNTDYGNLLKQEVQTYRDLGQKRQGTFSSLGTLDSSAYQDQQARADEDLAQQQANTGLQQNRQLKQVNDSLNAYSAQANSQLAQLGIQYQQGKNAIASALANNNLSEASAISNALAQIRQNAAQIQSNIANFANQAAILKNMGYNVGVNMRGISATPYAQQVQQYMQQAGLPAQQNASYSNVLPTKGLTGQGYIGGNTGTKDPNSILAQYGLTLPQ